MADTTDGADKGKSPGAILTDAQIAKLRLLVIGMSIVLVAGVATVIARIVYLVNRGGEQATVSRASETIAAETRIVLPAGAIVKSTGLSGNRLSAHYTSPKGEGIIILDLATGKTLSHVRFEPSP